uniref:Autophagy-related protein 13 n=1 Tax=Angiostrongylus cantonensis TaxID=6313 RepID=A0A0K0DEY7_ANGCA
METLDSFSVVVQSRTNEKFNLECTLPSNNPDWFNLRIDELGEVSAQVKRSISSFPPVIKCISIDFLLYTCDGEVLPMETWYWANDIKSQLYLQLSVMLRSAMVAARMTPLHRYYVKKQSCDTFVILYRLGEGLSELDLGTEAKRLELGRFPTPAGAFRLEVAYRTQMERALSPRDGHESPNQTDITGAFGDVRSIEREWCIRNQSDTFRLSNVVL